MLLGEAQHGKDTVADLFTEFLPGMTSMSSSLFCIEEFIFDEVGVDLGYSTPMELYLNRDNHRDILFNRIVEYNTPNLSKLGMELLSKYPIYIGCRNINEFLALKNNRGFDISIWVDASNRKPKEPSTSMTISKSHADIIIDNNGTLAELNEKVKSICNLLQLI